MRCSTCGGDPCCCVSRISFRPHKDRRVTFGQLCKEQPYFRLPNYPGAIYVRSANGCYGIDLSNGQALPIDPGTVIEHLTNGEIVIEVGPAAPSVTVYEGPR
jgi:hypothetical protein